MSRRRKRKNISVIIDEYILSNKIHDYYELPAGIIRERVETEDDYFLVKMNATPALKKDAKSINGIQQRIIKAVRNSIIGHCFAGYDMKDTVVSINQSSDKYSANIFNIKSLEQHLDSTSCSAVRIFSGRMANGYYKLAATLKEKGAVVYVHKSALYLAAFDMLGAFIPSESNREGLVDEMQRRADDMAKVHF